VPAPEDSQFKQVEPQNIYDNETFLPQAAISFLVRNAPE
jgi:hypothetical protein